MSDNNNHAVETLTMRYEVLTKHIDRNSTKRTANKCDFRKGVQAFLKAKRKACTVSLVPLNQTAQQPDTTPIAAPKKKTVESSDKYISWPHKVLSILIATVTFVFYLFVYRQIRLPESLRDQTASNN